MRIDAIGLGLLTALLGFSLSVSAQVSPDLLDELRSEPSVEEPETPNPESSEDTTPNVDRENRETEEAGEEPETNGEEENTTNENENADEVDAADDEANTEDANSSVDSTETEEFEESESSLPLLPDGCEALPLVNGEGSEVTKRTSPPSFTIPIPLPGPIPDPRVQSNWNTDWYIPNAQDFNHYRVVIMPRSSGRYSIQMFFKYPDDTADEFYEDQEIRLTANEPLIIEAEPRPDLPPYQINANIGGLLSIGVRYTIVVAGCSGDGGAGNGEEGGGNREWGMGNK